MIKLQVLELSTQLYSGGISRGVLALSDNVKCKTFKDGLMLEDGDTTHIFDREGFYMHTIRRER